MQGNYVQNLTYLLTEYVRRLIRKLSLIYLFTATGIIKDYRDLNERTKWTPNRKMTPISTLHFG